jgi:hypothetical protein
VRLTTYSTPLPRSFLEVRILNGLWREIVEVLILQTLKSLVFSVRWTSLEVRILRRLKSFVLIQIREFAEVRILKDLARI